MRIQRIKLQNFGCHNQLNLSFEPGLNIIKGPNGSGKSTLQRALLKVLFDKPSKSVTNEKDRAWDSERLYTLTLDFEVAGRGTGQLIKDFESSRCRLQWQSGEELTTFSTVDSELKSLMNIPSDKLFTSTLFVAQEELTAPSAGKEITTSLEERVTSGHAGITTQKAVERLAKEIDRYGKGYGTGGRATKLGLIAEMQKERERLEEQIVYLRQRLTQFLQFQSHYQETDQQLKVVQSELLSKRTFASQIDKVERLRKQVALQAATEQQLDDQVEAINKARKELESIEQALRQIGPVSLLETNQHQSLSQLFSQVHILQNRTMPAPPSTPVPTTVPTPRLASLPTPVPTQLPTPRLAPPPTPVPTTLPLPTPPLLPSSIIFRQPIGAFVLLGVGLLAVLAGVLLFALQLVGFGLALGTLLLGLFSLLGGAGWWMKQQTDHQNALLRARQQAEFYAQQLAQAQASRRAQQLAQQQAELHAQQQAEQYSQQLAQQQAELRAQQLAQQQALQQAQQRAQQQAELYAQQQAEQYATMLKQHEQAKAKALSDLQQALLAVHCTSWQEYIKKQGDTTQEKARKNAALAKLAALLAQANGLPELQEKRKIASRARRDAEEALESPELQPALRMNPFEQQELLRNFEQLVEKNTSLLKTYHELNGRLLGETISPTDLIQAEEKLEALTQKLTQYKELLAVYQRTHELLLKAREQTIQRVRQDLETSTSRHFAHLTLEKFGAVAIDHDLKMRVTIPGLVERSVDPQELSCGTQDQLYFAMRLALIDNLWADSQPPLFLDDPFVTFDPERRQAAMQMCCNLAMTRQIFLFTCSDDYDAFGNVLSLHSSEFFVLDRQLQIHE